MISEIIKAYEFAKVAHGHQKRKYTGEPYITHPIAVTTLVNYYGEIKDGSGNIDMLEAAMLHDVLEDTQAAYGDIYREFGEDVANLVSQVTDASSPLDGRRDVRKEIDRQHLAKASPKGQNIKLADLIHNTESIVKHDKKFAKVYLEEKRLLLEVLTKGHPVLTSLAYSSLAESLDELE